MTGNRLDTAAIEAAPGLRLSPPPGSGGLAALSTALTVITFVAIASYAVAGFSGPTVGTAAPWVTWVFLCLGVLAAAIPVGISVFAVQQSLKAKRLVQEGGILQARGFASKSRESALTALGIMFAVIVIGLLLLMLVANDAAVQKTFLRWDIIGDSFFAVTKAFGMNIFIAVVAEIIVLVLGLALAVARLIPGRAGAPIRWLAIGYIDMFRAVPAIIVIYLVGFGLPLTGLPLFQKVSPTWFAIIALALTYAAYTAETYRSGIESIHASQFSASRSLGFSFFQTMRYVILPQAIRVVIPPLLTMFIGLQKDTALVNIIGAMDAFNRAKYTSATMYNLSAVTIVALLFVILTIPQTRLVDWWLDRGVKMRGGAKR